MAEADADRRMVKRGGFAAIDGVCPSGWLTFLWPPLTRYLSPYNLAPGMMLALDTSISLEGMPLAELQDAARTGIGTLRPEDRAAMLS